MRVREKFAWVMLTALGLFVVAAVTGVATSGPLDPPGPVGSTMKTLEEIPGSWSRVLSTAGADPCHTDRFRCVLNDEAVLDLETGLVWQRDPGTGTTSWTGALFGCPSDINTGDRRGWRLPSLYEVTTLVDGTGNLPQPHPFLHVGDDFVYHWTATEVDDTLAIGVRLVENQFDVTALTMTISHRWWCVRGPA